VRATRGELDLPGRPLLALVCWEEADLRPLFAAITSLGDDLAGAGTLTLCNVLASRWSDWHIDGDRNQREVLWRTIIR
jgi:hypothetical protein